jgi:hypothetical protein
MSAILVVNGWYLYYSPDEEGYYWQCPALDWVCSDLYSSREVAMRDMEQGNLEWQNPDKADY